LAAAHRGQIEWDSVKRASIALIAACGASAHSAPIATRSHQAHEIRSPTSSDEPSFRGAGERHQRQMPG
jgi:hypothetical protein